jgi:integrase
MHRVLKQALAQAVAWHELVRNEAAAVKPPKVERKQMKVLDTDATAALIEAAPDTTLFVPILLGVTTGMRRGEVTALRWRHVDLDRGQISVEESVEQTKTGIRYKAPKSSKGRTVALPKSFVDELRNHRIRQAEALLKVGTRLSEDAFVIAGRRQPAPATLFNACFRTVLSQAQAASCSSARPAPFACDRDAEEQGPPQGGTGTTRTLDDSYHDGYLQPRSRRHAGGRRRDS